MLEVFTIGGGEYIVNVFNAVAAWTGSGGYASMIKVVMVMALIYVLLIVAFNQDWRAWMNWFLQSTLIYLCLMVPTVTIKVTDRINPSLAPAVVANVPLGLGVIASFTSQIGDYLTREAETVFVMPAQLKYSSNGMLYGSKLMEATRQIRITDPEFGANINEHMKRCVFYDVMLGFKSMDTLAKSTDLWSDIGPGSAARAQNFIVRTGSGPGSTTSTTIITCEDAYANLTPQWNAFLTGFRPIWAKSLYPGLSNAAAEAKLVADLPATNAAFTGNASSALEIMRQNIAMNAFMQARDDMSGGTGASAIDSFAATRADIQTRNTYSAIAQGAMKWVPILNIVLTVVFYAMFPVIFPLFLFPRTGVSTLKGYTVGFFYLAAWGPLYVILHMILMSRGMSAANAIAPGGSTLGSFAGIGAVNDETAVLAGYMIATIPFLAAGMARGAMAIASQATSFLGPSQNAAEQAAAEATTGNYAYGNASLANATINTQSRDQWNTAPTFTKGAGPAFAFREANGAVTTLNSDGSFVTNQSGAISSFETKPSFSASDMSEIRATASEFQSKATNYREASGQSLSAANTTGAQIFDTVQKAKGNEYTRGTGVTDAINTVQRLERGISDKLVNDYGWSREDAERGSVSAIERAELIGSAGISLSKQWGGKRGENAKSSSPELRINGAGSGSLSTSAQQLTDKSSSLSASERINQGLEFLKSEGLSEQASSARESFFRAAATSGDSQLKGMTDRRDASLTDARSNSLEASRLEETGKRYSRDFSEIGSSGVSSNTDLSQAFQSFVTREMATNPAIRDSGYETWMRESDVKSGEYGPRAERALNMLQHRFTQSIKDEMRAELGSPEPLGMGSVPRPDVSSAAEVRGFGDANMGAVRSLAPQIDIRDDLRDSTITTGVADRLDGSGARMDARERQAGADGRLAHGLGDGLRANNQRGRDAPLYSSMPGVGPIVDGVMGREALTNFQGRPYVQQQGLGIKPGVRLSGLKPEMAPVIQSVASSAASLGLRPPTITSALDGVHGKGGTVRTLHPSGHAVDIRTRDMTSGQAAALARRIDASLPSSYDVVLKSDHIHTEYDPEPKGRRK